MTRSLKKGHMRKDKEVLELFGLKLKVTERNMMTVTKYMKKLSEGERKSLFSITLNTNNRLKFQ